MLAPCQGTLSCWNIEFSAVSWCKFCIDWTVQYLKILMKYSPFLFPFTLWSLPTAFFKKHSYTMIPSPPCLKLRFMHSGKTSSPFLLLTDRGLSLMRQNPLLSMNKAFPQSMFWLSWPPFKFFLLAVVVSNGFFTPRKGPSSYGSGTNFYPQLIFQFTCHGSWCVLDALLDY